MSSASLQKHIILRAADLEILEALSLKKYRFLTCHHLSMLYFSSDAECSYRMKQLYRMGLISTMFLPTVSGDQQMPIYTLSRAGAVYLAQSKGISPAGLASVRRASYLFLEHALHVANFVATLEAALKLEGRSLVSWKSERELKSPSGRPLKVPNAFKDGDRIPLIPDAYLCLRTERQLEHFFLEADRGTMSLYAMKKKLASYIQFFRNRLHEKCFNIPHFRVLLVTTTPYRRDKLRQILREAGFCGNMVWFGIWADITPQKILGKIWLKCRDQEYHSLMR